MALGEILGRKQKNTNSLIETQKGETNPLQVGPNAPSSLTPTLTLAHPQPQGLHYLIVAENFNRTVGIYRIYGSALISLEKVTPTHG